MRNEKIAVFPVDEDFLFIPNNENIELGKKRYKISYYITLAGWNVGNTEKQLYALDEFNFKNIDTLVLINSLRKLEDDVIQKICEVIRILSPQTVSHITLRNWILSANL